MNNVIKFLTEKIFVEENLSVVVACSGGPDSMALLDIIVSLRDKKNINIICAHVNHKLRIESEQEKIDVENFCKKNNIIFEYMEINKYSNGNFHAQAREIRYNFFDSLMNKYGAKYLFTAHHGDDLIETILMRISRGSTVKGYSGFEKISKKGKYYIVKPLIYVTKQQLLEYVQAKGIVYGVDKSNEKSVYTRNRYRKNVLPFLKEENKNIHEKYLKFSEQLIKYENYIDKQVEILIPKFIKNNKLYINDFKNLDIVIQEKLIICFLDKVYINNISCITSEHIKQIINLINSEKPNSFISLPKNKKVIKTYTYISVKNIDDFNNQEYKIELIDEVKINNKTLKIVEDSCDTSNYTIRLNSNEISLPLYIRNINISDKIAVKGLNGTKKVKDIYIDMKILKEDRKQLPILVDNKNKILWLPGLKKSKYDKAKSEKYDIIIRYI